MTDANPENILIDDVYFNVRATNTLRNWHEFDSDKRPPLKTLGDITKLSQSELLQVPNCGRKTLKEIEEVLEEHGLFLKNVYRPNIKVVSTPALDGIRIRELEDKNDRLLLELGYLQGEIAKSEAYKDQIAKLEHRIIEIERSNNRAWEIVKQVKHEQEVTRGAAADAIWKLQAELSRANEKA
jgi:hypothetical protein